MVKRLAKVLPSFPFFHPFTASSLSYLSLGLENSQNSRIVRSWLRTSNGDKSGKHVKGRRAFEEYAKQIGFDPLITTNWFLLNTKSLYSSKVNVFQYIFYNFMLMFKKGNTKNIGPLWRKFGKMSTTYFPRYTTCNHSGYIRFLFFVFIYLFIFISIGLFIFNFRIAL